MPPAAQTVQYTDQASIEGLMSAEGLVLRLDDDRDGAASTAELVRVSTAIGFATSRVNLYCQSRYSPAELAKSWSVWNWATVLACWWLSRRKGNSPPGGLQGMYEETMEELKEVKAARMVVDDAAMRETLAPAWSNVRVDPRYRLRQARVERQISERTRKTYPENRDVGGDYIVEPR